VHYCICLFFNFSVDSSQNNSNLLCSSDISNRNPDSVRSNIIEVNGETVASTDNSQVAEVPGGDG